MVKSFRGAAAPAFALSLIGGLSLAPSVANAGFLEQLFGVAPAPQPYYSEAPSAAPQSGPLVVHRAKKRAVAVATKPTLQKPTDLMHDATLRPGDAVMMKDGIHVYEGDDASKHSIHEFVAIEHADDVSRTKRVELIAMDTTRNDPLRDQLTPDTLASGRSASVSGPITPGYQITDARGKPVRYVGP